MKSISHYWATALLSQMDKMETPGLTHLASSGNGDKDSLRSSAEEHDFGRFENDGQIQKDRQVLDIEEIQFQL